MGRDDQITTALYWLRGEKVPLRDLRDIRVAARIDNAEKALKETGLEGRIVKIKAIEEIMKRGVMFTPALSVNGVVKCAGKVPSVDEIRAWLAAAK